MTTSEPRTPHDDTPREHRRLGQRILDAVLGDPADTRPDDPADPRRGDPNRAERRTGAEGFAGDGPRGDYASYEQATRDHPVGGTVQDDRAATQGYLAPTPDAGDMPTNALHDVGQAGHTNRDDALRDAGQNASDPVSDARRDAGQAGYVDRDDAVRDAGYDARQDAGQAGCAERNDAVRDVGDTAFDDRRGAGRADTTAAPLDPGHDQPGSRAETAAAHDLTRPGAGTAGDDRDLVTSSYDPDRDAGYDPHAAGTAMGGATGAGVARGGTDYDAGRDTGDVDDPRHGGARDYDPAQDTGYVDASRAETDRTTGRRDDDFDTGRVDTGRADLGRADLDLDRDDLDRDAGDRVPTEPVDRDRDDTHRGAGVAAGAAGAGAVAAAALRGDRSDADRDRDLDRDRDARFSAVDDTATVDGTGRSTPEAAAAGNGRADAGVADEDGESGTRERLVPAERADDYGSRWDALKGDFVDEPRRAVRQADELVGELLDELQRLFADQRRNLEQGFDHDQASTEDLRLALRRYRSFFDRLLSF
jgi:hypothetical protein